MAITFIGSSGEGANTGTTATNTHGVTILSGDLVVASLAVNGTGNTAALQGASGGATWNHSVQDNAGPGSMIHGVQYVIANGSEPSQYTWALGSSGRWAVNLYVFRGVDNTTPVDVAATNRVSSGTTVDSADITVATNSVAVLFGYGDTGSGSFTAIDSSYIGLISTPNQLLGSGYRIYTTGGATGSIQMSWDQSRTNESEHMSFAVVPAGGGGLGIPIAAYHHFHHNLD